MQPEWLSAADIDVKVGTIWIDIEDYKQFMYELFDTPNRFRIEGKRIDMIQALTFCLINIV